MELEVSERPGFCGSRAGENGNIDNTDKMRMLSRHTLTVTSGSSDNSSGQNLVYFLSTTYVYDLTRCMLTATATLHAGLAARPAAAQ